jgi:hypothetical protein
MVDLVDMEKDFLRLYEHCKPFTMTSIERMYSVFKSVEYICKANIPGDFVECGVWKGGSSMMAAASLMHFDKKRELYLYDTFEGMPEADSMDVSYQGKKGGDYEGEMIGTWDEVIQNIQETGYDLKYLNMIKGIVEDTIPGKTPFRIALLRLDTDWYRSTLHELTHLFPLLSKGGVLIIDDYGHWEGARKATDEYFESIGIVPFLSRIDYTGRIYVKP